MAIFRGFIPFGEYKPDLRYLINDGLLTADGVIPVYGNYISSPVLTRVANPAVSSSSHGLYVDPTSGRGYASLGSTIKEFQEDGTVTDVTPAGYLGAADFFYGMQGCSFGQNVVLTTGDINPVCHMKPGSPPFVNTITSTFNPKAGFCFPFKDNLFLAHCFLSGAYDTLSSGANPTLVAWSRNGVITLFGSANVNPEYIGAGFQPLNFEIGKITGASGGAAYAAIVHSNGVTRIDGPPYTFRVVAKGIGTIFPNSVVIAGEDLWFMSGGGLCRLQGGEGPPEIIGVGKWLRSFLDNTTGAGVHPISAIVAGAIIGCSIAHDPINDLLFISFVESGDTRPRSLLVYNIREKRTSYFQLFSSGAASQIRFLRSGTQANANAWIPGRDIRFIETVGSIDSGATFYGKMTLGNSGMNSVLQKGYIQLKQDRTTRFRRIRPIYNVTDQAAIEQISVTIESTNKPYATPTVKGPYTTRDPEGWIVTPDTAFADFHSVKFIVTANASMHKIVEYEGFEHESIEGPERGA